MPESGDAMLHSGNIRIERCNNYLHLELARPGAR